MDIDEETDFPNENLNISLENIGEGVATEIRLDLNIIPIEPEFTETRHYSALQRPLQPRDRKSQGYISTGMKNRPIPENDYNHLTSESYDEFQSMVIFRFSSDDPDSEYVFLPISVLIRLLRSQGVEKARLQIGIEYRDTIQNKYRLEVLSIDFKTEHEDSFKDIVDNGEMLYSDDSERKMLGEYSPTVSETNEWLSNDGETK